MTDHSLFIAILTAVTTFVIILLICGTYLAASSYVFTGTTLIVIALVTEFFIFEGATTERQRLTSKKGSPGKQE